MFEQIKLYISNKWEKLYPLLFSSMICLLLYFFKDNEIIDKCYYKCFDKTFISALVTAKSIVFGFLLTTMVTLMQLNNSAIKNLIDTNRFPELIQYNKTAVIYSFLSVILTCVFLLTLEIQIPYYNIFVAIWIFVMNMVIFLSYRFLNIFYSFLKR